MLFDTHHHITMLIQAPEYFQCLDDNYSNAGHACHPTIVLNDELDLHKVFSLYIFFWSLGTSVVAIEANKKLYT